MHSSDEAVAISFFQEHPRQRVSVDHRLMWTVAVLHDNESVGNPAPRAFSSSEYAWRGAAWIGFHLRSHGNRRWRVVCVKGRLTADSVAQPAMRPEWFSDRDEACWRALEISRELARRAGLGISDPREAPVELRIPAIVWFWGTLCGIGLIVVLQILIGAVTAGLKVQDWMPLADILIGACVGAWATAAVRRKWLARQRRRAATQLTERRAAFPEWAADAGERS